MIELVIGLLLGGVIAVGRWRAYQWSRSPLGQAQAAVERARLERQRQREALDASVPPARAALLAILALAFIAWAAGAR